MILYGVGITVLSVEAVAYYSKGLYIFLDYFTEKLYSQSVVFPKGFDKKEGKSLRKYIKRRLLLPTPFEYLRLRKDIKNENILEENLAKSNLNKKTKKEIINNYHQDLSEGKKVIISDYLV